MKVKKKRKIDASIPSASMSDIAFLLIIFFMVSTVFNVDIGINYDLPNAIKPDVIIDKLNLHVTIPNQENPGQKVEKNMVLVEGEPVRIEDLKNQILKMRAERPDIYYVVLKADEAVPFSIINRVMTEIKETKITKLKLAAEFKSTK